MAAEEPASLNQASNGARIPKRFCCGSPADQPCRPPPMIPIQDLLHRIQWDMEFGSGTFMIGYYDRIEARIVRVPFRRVHLARGEHFSFDVEEDDGTTHMVPFHRVREVWRNGELIWQRKVRDH